MRQLTLTFASAAKLVVAILAIALSAPAAHLMPLSLTALANP